MSESDETKPRIETWGDGNRLDDVDRLSRWTIAAERSMVMRCRFDQGCVVPEHSHPEEQISVVFEGELEFVIAGPGAEPTRCTAGAGDVVVIPGGLEHTARALTDVLSMDVFTPIRTELLPALERKHQAQSNTEDN